jgi:hypothetical protein
MKYLTNIFVALTLVLGLLVIGTQDLSATGNKASFAQSYTPSQVQSVGGLSYVNSGVDTLYYEAENNVLALNFSATYSDSVSLTNVVLYRYPVNHAAGNFESQRNAVLGTQTALVGDTLFTTAMDTSHVGRTAGTTVSFGAPVVLLQSTTVGPVGEYMFVVKYAASLNGVTTPTVSYNVTKVYGGNK